MILAFPLIAYSIVRYRLMGIKLFLSRTTVFAFLFSVASMLVYFPLFFWQRTLQDLLGKYWVFVPIFASFFVGISFIPFYRLMTKLTNRIFFQKRYEYHRLLNGLVEKISEADNVNKLLQSVSQTIWENIRPNKIGLLVFEPQEKAYVLRISKGENWLSPGFKMTENACLCKTLRMIKRPLMQTEIRLIGAKARQSFLKKEEWRRAEESFRQLKVSLCVPGFLKHKLLGIMLLDDKISGQLYDPEEIDLLFAVMEEMVSVMSDFQLKQEKDNLVLDTFLLISKTMEAKDEYTKNHIEDSSRYAQLFVHELKKLPDFKKIENLGQKLRTVALLHDLGKIGIPDRILNKKGPLSKKEYELIKRHCQIGASIISSVRSINKDIVEGIKYHQERYDGSGYPEGLKGKAIPPLARAVSVIDVYLALISERPYRKAMPPEKAIEIILSEKGRYFDPEVVEGFLKMLTSEFSPKPNLFHTASLA
jgi:HD-GYP domain-containing protein (c-di-GMP phosphodiesterase class II)